MAQVFHGNIYQLKHGLDVMRPQEQMNTHTIGRAALIVDARIRDFDLERAARAGHQASVRGRETHVRVFGCIQVLRGAASHRRERVGTLVVAVCGTR